MKEDNKKVKLLTSKEKKLLVEDIKKEVYTKLYNMGHIDYKTFYRMVIKND